MRKYLAITAALALTLTACGQTAADSTPTPTAATEATAAPAEQPQSIGSGALRLLTAAADGVYYQVFNDWEINYTDTIRRWRSRIDPLKSCAGVSVHCRIPGRPRQKLTFVLISNTI